MIFLRSSEDTSLPKKRRQRLINTMPDKHNSVKHAIPEAYKGEHLEEAIDSNILWAFLSYCTTRAQDNISAFLSILKGQAIEFSKKCARLL